MSQSLYLCLLVGKGHVGLTSAAIIVVAHRDAERLWRIEVEFLVAAVEESGGGRVDGLEGQVGRASTCEICFSGRDA